VGGTDRVFEGYGSGSSVAWIPVPSGVMESW